MSRRLALAATVTALGAYVLWTIAAADDTGSPSVWTVLTAGAFWLAVVVLVVAAARAVFGLRRRG